MVMKTVGKVDGKDQNVLQGQTVGRYPLERCSSSADKDSISIRTKAGPYSITFHANKRPGESWDSLTEVSAVVSWKSFLSRGKENRAEYVIKNPDAASGEIHGDYSEVKTPMGRVKAAKLAEDVKKVFRSEEVQELFSFNKRDFGQWSGTDKKKTRKTVPQLLMEEKHLD